jgi:tetratricopeptide (TPR) repeat protein
MFDIVGLRIAAGKYALGRRIVRLRTCRAVVLALLLEVAPAFGAGQGDYDGCMQNVDQDRRIAGCARIIDDVGESNRNRRIAYDNRGTAWHAKGENDRAIADYTEAIKLNPKDVPAYNNRGTAWRDKGDLDRALADYNVAIRLDPNDAAAYNNRGNIRHEKGDDTGAIGDFTEAVRIDPKYALAYCNRGNAWHAKGDKDRAVADCTEAIRLDPNNAVSYRIRGTIYFDIGNFAAATQDLQRANELAADPYGALLLFIARGRAGEDGAVELAVNGARLRINDWPAPVIDFYLGRRSFDEMRGAAVNPAQRCEAAFYGGEWLLLRGNPRESKALLQDAARICAKTLKEYSIATFELKRMKP